MAHHEQDPLKAMVKISLSSPAAYVYQFQGIGDSHHLTERRACKLHFNITGEEKKKKREHD